MTLRTCAMAMLTLATFSALALAVEPATKPSGPPLGAGGPAPATPPDAPQATCSKCGKAFAYKAAAEKSVKCPFCGNMVVVSTNGPATPPTATTTSAPASEPTEEEIDLPPYYMVMVKEVDMPEAQQKQLAAEVKKRTAAMEVWTKAHGDERKNLQTDLVAAYKERDKDNIALLKGKLAELDTQKRELEKKLDKQVESVLTEKQRTAWDGYLLYDKVMGPFWDLKLDDGQKTSARNICIRSVGTLMKVQSNKDEADKFYDELYKSIRERVLTQEQRDKLDKKPTTAPATAPATPAAPAAPPAQKFELEKSR